MSAEGHDSKDAAVSGEKERNSKEFSFLNPSRAHAPPIPAPGSGVICETRASHAAAVPPKLIPAKAGSENPLLKPSHMRNPRTGFPLSRE
jgi:hypothetical protein